VKFLTIITQFLKIQGTAEEERSKEAESVKRELGITDAQIIPSTYLELYRKLKTADSGVDDMSSDASAE
jgi:adenylate cyclase class IV